MQLFSSRLRSEAGYCSSVERPPAKRGLSVACLGRLAHQHAAGQGPQHLAERERPGKSVEDLPRRCHAPETGGSLDHYIAPTQHGGLVSGFHFSRATRNGRLACLRGLNKVQFKALLKNIMNEEALQLMDLKSGLRDGVVGPVSPAF